MKEYRIRMLMDDGTDTKAIWSNGSILRWNSFETREEAMERIDLAYESWNRRREHDAEQGLDVKIPKYIIQEREITEWK